MLNIKLLVTFQRWTNYDYLLIKGQNTITYDCIKQMGFNDEAKYFTVQELSWFLLVDPKTKRHILVKMHSSKMTVQNTLMSSYRINLRQ